MCVPMLFNIGGIYEKNEGAVHILFLRGLALSLRNVCCEEFYGASWEEFKDNGY